MSITEFLSQPVWQRLGLTLVHFLWQGLAVAVLVGVLVRVFRLNHGNARYAAYLLAFIAMIVCPVVTFTAIDITISPNNELVTGAEFTEVVESSPYTALSAGDILPEAETPRPALPTLTDSIPLGERISGWLHISMPWILVIWMVGVVVLSVRLLMGFVGVYRWRHHLEPLPERLVQRIASLSERLGMRGFSGVFISPTVLQAMAVGYLRPMVLLPAAMVTQMQPEMLEAVIAHELAHIRRLDLWINLAQRVTETLLFYHPAVWWLSICLRSERELCCDELAVKATGRRLTYATTLESVGRAKVMAKQPVLAAGLGQDKKPTLSRVRHILGLTPTQRNCPFWLAGVITVLFLAALVIPTTLALTSRTNEQADIQEKKDQKELSKFKTTLPNGVTVELLCLYYGKDIKDSKFWKPDGSLMSNLESQKYRERAIFPKWSSKDFKFEYGLMVRFNPLDSLSTDVFVKQGQRMTYSYPKSDGLAIALVASDRSDRKAGFSRVGTIKAAAATGPWDTHKSSARISEPSVRYLDDRSMIMFSPPRKTDEWLLDVTVNSDSIDLDCFYELKEGSIHHARSSGTIGHPDWIGPEQRTPMSIKQYSLFHEPEQIKNYIIKYRKFEIIEFKNISLQPGIKPDVQVEVEKPNIQVQSKVQFELITRPLTRKGVELQWSKAATLQYWNEVFDLDSETVSHYELGARRWPNGADIGFDIDMPQEIRDSLYFGINSGYKTTGHRFLALESYSFEQAVWETSDKLDELRNSRWMGHGLLKHTLPKFPAFFTVLTDGYSVKADSSADHPAPKLAIIEVVEARDKSAEIKYWLERKAQKKPAVQVEKVKRALQAAGQKK
ncbi:MAG TPA: M56 family metallopeptidase [Sedimentisphaerales bacterium]|nr:M56 family metallopeptidase [Sedimentisphaerales bacterium]